VKDARSQRRIGLPSPEDVSKMRDSPGASAGNHRNAHGAADRRSQFAIEAIPHSIGIHRSKQNFSCASGLCFFGPLNGSSASILPPAMGENARVTNRIGRIWISASIDGHNHRLRAEAGSNLANQVWIGQRSRIDADLIGSSLKDSFSIGSGSDTPTNSKRDKERLRRPANRVEQSSSTFVRSSDVQQHDFVRTRLGMACGERSRVAGVDKVNELDAFDHTAVAAIQAGNNTSS
jgi:hypothetical protein